MEDTQEIILLSREAVSHRDRPGLDFLFLILIRAVGVGVPRTTVARKVS